MHGLDGIERHNEVARVFDVHDELRATHRGHLADSTELFAAVGDKGLKPHLDVLVHDPSPSMQPAESPTGPFGLRSIPPAGAISRRSRSCLPAPRNRLERGSRHFRIDSVKLRGSRDGCAIHETAPILLPRPVLVRLCRSRGDDGWATALKRSRILSFATPSWSTSATSRGWESSSATRG